MNKTALKKCITAGTEVAVVTHTRQDPYAYGDPHPIKAIVLGVDEKRWANRRGSYHPHRAEDGVRVRLLGTRPPFTSDWCDPIVKFGGRGFTRDTTEYDRSDPQVVIVPSRHIMSDWTTHEQTLARTTAARNAVKERKQQAAVAMQDRREVAQAVCNELRELGYGGSVSYVDGNVTISPAAAERFVELLRADANEAIDARHETLNG